MPGICQNIRSAPQKQPIPKTAISDPAGHGPCCGVPSTACVGGTFSGVVRPGNAWPAVGIAGAVRRRNTVRSLISVTWLGCSAQRLTQPSSPIGCSVVDGVRSVVRVLTRPGWVVDGERLSPRFVILARGGPDLGIQRSIDAR